MDAITVLCFQAQIHPILEQELGSWVGTVYNDSYQKKEREKKKTTESQIE